MNTFKNLLIAVLAAGLLLALLWGCYLYRQQNKAELLTAASPKSISLDSTVVRRYTDDAGHQHTVIRADQNVLAPNWYKNGTAIRGGLIDTVAAALHIARKQLQQVTQIALLNEARAAKAEVKVDSLQRISYTFKNKHMQVIYRPPVSATDTSDHGQFDYRYNDSLNVVQYWKKKWFLGAKTSYIDVFSNDPHTTVNGVHRLVVQQKEPTFGLRVQAVGNYNFSRKLLNAGPGVQFDVKRFSIVATYYYDFETRLFRPNLGARYDLIRF